MRGMRLSALKFPKFSRSKYRRLLTMTSVSAAKGHLDCNGTEARTKIIRTDN